MAKSYEELKNEISAITNEVEDGANTANRIGGAMADIADFAKEVTDIQSEDTDKKVSELEASTEQKLKDLVVQETGDGEGVVMSQKAVTAVSAKKEDGLTNNGDLNQFLKELVLLNGDGTLIKTIVISNSYLYSDGYYYNTLRIFYWDDTRVDWYSKKFQTLEEAQSDLANGKIVCNDNIGYAYIKNIGVDFVGQRSISEIKFNKPLTAEANPIIKSHLMQKEIDDNKQIIETAFSAIHIHEEETLIPTSGTAYGFSLGEEPILEEKSDYKTFVVQGLVVGDFVLPNIKSGSSYYSYAKLLNGVCVQLGKKGEECNQEITCDGSFDSIMFNNYNSFVRQPTCSVFRSKKVNEAVEELSKKVDEFEGGSRKKLKILCFGNSFTQDSMSYVPFILNNIAPELDLTLFVAVIGGCPLVQHCVNFTGESMMLGSTTYEVKPYSLYKYYPKADKWEDSGQLEADDILLSDDWDIITFQQNGNASDADWDIYYAPYIFKLHKTLYSKVPKSVKLGWLSVHGAYKSTFEDLYNKWLNTVENTKKIENLTGNQIVFPYGTAVQNLRTTPLSELGDGGYLMGDTAHLHEGIGCLTAAYANALKIAEVAGLGYVSIIGEKTRPTKDWCSAINVLSPHYGSITKDVIGITEDNCYTAQIAAIMAIKKPYEVTDCNAFL